MGYGDITPANDGERVFVIFGLIIGASYFSYVVGSVCSVLAKLSAKEEMFQLLMCELVRKPPETDWCRALRGAGRRRSWGGLMGTHTHTAATSRLFRSPGSVASAVPHAFPPTTVPL